MSAKTLSPQISTTPPTPFEEAFRRAEAKPLDPLSLATHFIDRGDEYDQTHWIPQKSCGEPGCTLLAGHEGVCPPTLSAEEFAAAGYVLPDEFLRAVGERTRDDRFVHFRFVLDRDLNPFEICRSGTEEPIAVTTSIEAAEAARRLLR